MKPTLSHQAKPSAEVLVQAVGDEAVLLNLATERYFGLDPVGTRIWTLLSQDPRLEQAFDALCAEYEVEPARLEADLLDLIGQLAEAKLVQLS
jgi:hypothetical protein